MENNGEENDIDAEDDEDDDDDFENKSLISGAKKVSPTKKPIVSSR